jgi:hypothetical protein
MKTRDEIRRATARHREDERKMYERHAKESMENKHRRKAIEAECPHETVKRRRYVGGFFEMCVDCGKDLG